MENNYKSGFVAIIGRPNVGKSTFLNTVVGTKVAIMSSKPQTTRNKILGIMTRNDMQLAFTDTPGIHKPATELDKRMVDASYDATRGVDAIIFMTTPTKKVLPGDEIILRNIKNAKIPVLLVINKVDELNKISDIDLTIALYKDIINFYGVYPISVLENKNIDHLLADIKEIIPAGPKYYPDEMVSDHGNSFLVAELIREKILLVTEEEVPHSVAVVVEVMQPNRENPNITDIIATIYVERTSQKKIIIGAQGSKLNQIKAKAIPDIKKILKTKVNLDLWIKIKKDWKDRPNDLKVLGYSTDTFK